MEKLKSLVRSIKLRMVAAALLLIALGVLFVLRPGSSGMIICYIVGGVLCLSGVVRFILYFTRDTVQTFGSFDLVSGAALLLFGGYILLRPEVLYGILTAVFGIILIVDGVLKLQYAIDLHRMKGSGWWAVLAVALLMAVLGIVALFNPFATMVTLMTFLGVVLIADGIVDILSISYLHVVAKQFGKAVNDAYTAATAIDTEGEVVDEHKQH